MTDASAKTKEVMPNGGLELRSNIQKSVIAGDRASAKTRETRIKVLAKWPWPGNHADFPTAKCLPKPTEAPVLTIGTPKEPALQWHCGTDVVWPVYEVNGKEIPLDDSGRRPYVCRHQIEAGD